MTERADRVCPVERAGTLDSRVRRWVQNPDKILGPWVKEGMVAVDLGCGPGFFTLAMARMVGESGRAIAADLQEGMLEKVRDKIHGTELEARIELHRCEAGSAGLPVGVDFVLAFYVVHEVPDQEAFFSELAGVLKEGGRLMVVEPPFHVSRDAFEVMVARAGEVGLEAVERPRVRFSKAVVLGKGGV